MADEHPRCGIWSDCYRPVERIAVALSAGEIEKGRRMTASRKGREPAAGVDILPEALCRRRRDESVYCVGWRAHPVHAWSQDWSFQRRCSVLLCLAGSVPGRCQNKAHRRFHRSSELVGAGDQHTLAGKHTDHIGPATTVRGGLRVDRTVGRSDSLTWSSCRLPTEA